MKNKFQMQGYSSIKISNFLVDKLRNEKQLCVLIEGAFYSCKKKKLVAVKGAFMVIGSGKRIFQM